MSSRKRFLWVFGTALALVALGSLAQRLRDVISPPPTAAIVPAPACDLAARPCTARLAGGGAVTLSVEPRGIPVARPLVLRVAIQGVEPSAVAVDLVGVDMDMGYNRALLTAAGPGHFRGDATLATCVRNHMTWEARVLLTTPRGLLAAPFRFDTTRTP